MADRKSAPYVRKADLAAELDRLEDAAEDVSSGIREEARQHVIQEVRAAFGLSED